jgi:hypothetical protein
MLENNPKLLSNDLAARHLRRKLKVRKQLRSRNVPIFNFDQIVRNVALKNSNPSTESGVNPLHKLKLEEVNQQILDRFQVGTEFPLTHCFTGWIFVMIPMVVSKISFSKDSK